MVEEVIQTATKLVMDELDAREAVTILATLARDAVPAGERLQRVEPERAGTYRELIDALVRELSKDADRDNHLPKVIEDLTRVSRSLG